MTRMTLLATALCCLAAGPALAELSTRQQAAYDVILPELVIGLTEQGGEAMAAMAPLMAGCVVEEARGRELRALGDGPFAPTDADLMNEIMARPDVQSCFIKAAGLG